MLKRFNHHFFPVLTVFFTFAVLLFGFRLSGETPKVADIAGLTVSCVALAIAFASGLIQDLERKIEKLLEPKTSYAPQVSSPIAPYPQRPHRYDIEHALVHALSSSLVANGASGKEVGEFIRGAADAILSGGLPAAKSSCTCGPNQGCSNCPVRHDAAAAVVGLHAGQTYGAAAGRVTVGNMEPHLASAGELADQRDEAEILAKGLTAPRVTAEQIQSLMGSLTWRYEQPSGTTSTFAHAFLGHFYLATGHSACVSPENFNAELGMKYAREQAEGKARDKLWELEGYKLFSAAA